MTTMIRAAPRRASSAAMVLARTTPRRRALGTLILMVPLWTNLLVKIYSWKAILGVKGVLNYGLQAAG